MATSATKHRQRADANIGFAASISTGPPAAVGRKSQFATNGSSRWPGIATTWLTCPSAQPPKGKFRGTAVSRPVSRPKSGIGARRHWPAHPDRLHPVLSCSRCPRPGYSFYQERAFAEVAPPTDAAHWAAPLSWQPLCESSSERLQAAAIGLSRRCGARTRSRTSIRYSRNCKSD